jgi:glycosyltransferase involved in cell wall biosynthesis
VIGRILRHARQRLRTLHSWRGRALLIRARLRSDTRRHNLLFIIPWMVVGGADKVNLDLATHLDKTVFSLHFLTTSPAEHLWATQFARVSQDILHLPDLIRPDGYERFIVSYIRLARIRTVLISNSLVGYRVAEAIKRHCPRVRVLDLLHGEGGQHEGGGFPYLSLPFEHLLDHRIVVTQYLKDLLVRKYQLDPRRITVVHSGIASSSVAAATVEHGRYRRALGLAADDFVVTYIGRFAPEKHPELVVAIADLLVRRQQLSRVHFVLAGDGPLRPQIERAIRQSPLLERRVHLTGYIRDPKTLMQDSDVLVLTSEAEGLPLVVLEAMSLGVPAIAPAVGGLPEIITHQRDGYLVPWSAHLVHDIAQLLQALASDDTTRQSLRVEARRKIAAAFSLERMIRGYEHILRAE